MNRFQCVADHQRRYGVKRLCSILGVSRSSFRYWRRTAAERVARQAADAQLAARIQAVHQDSDGTYGAPRITAELREASGEALNHKRAARIMRVFGIEGVRLRRRHRTTLPDPAAAKAADLIGREVEHADVAVGERGEGVGAVDTSAPRSRTRSTSVTSPTCLSTAGRSATWRPSSTSPAAV